MGVPISGKSFSARSDLLGETTDQSGRSYPYPPSRGHHLSRRLTGGKRRLATTRSRGADGQLAPVNFEDSVADPSNSGDFLDALERARVNNPLGERWSNSEEVTTELLFACGVDIDEVNSWSCFSCAGRMGSGGEREGGEREAADEEHSKQSTHGDTPR